jgi:hypothetical protein
VDVENKNGDGEKRQRGRPRGFKLSEESKQAISRSKEGQTHTQETKDKISRSLIIYFRKLYPLSEEIENRYCRVDDDKTCDWVHSVRSELNDLNDVLTDRVMRGKRRIELCCGNHIEYFSHNVTPEILLLFKEFCEENNLDPMKFLDELE